MPDDLEKQLKTLEGLNSTELRKLWRGVYRTPSPKGASQDFLIRGLAYRFQAKHFGGLTPSAQRRLQKMAKTVYQNPDADLVPTPLKKPGTRFVQEWDNRKHEVMVLETGFAHDGKVFDSLSKIAREITGTRWFGPVFVGLRQPKIKTA